MTNLDQQWSFGSTVAAIAPVLMLLVCNPLPVAGDEIDNRVIIREQNDPEQELDWNSLYGSGTSRDSVKARLLEVLEQRVDAIDHAYGLSSAQKKKLELAGRNSIKQLFDRITEREDLKPDNRGRTIKLRVSDREIIQLQLRLGPFGDDSLFGKTLRTVLTPEQVSQYRERQRLAATSNQPISVANAKHLMKVSTTPKNAFEIVWNRDGSQLGLLEFDKQIEICSSATGEVLRVVGEGKRCVHFDLSPDNNVIAIGENSEVATILDLSKGTELQLQTGQPQPNVKFSPDGKTVVTGGYGTKAKLWSATTGEQLREFDVGELKGGLRAIFSPDGTMLAVGNRNSTTYLFDAATGEWLHTFSIGQSQGLSFDPSSKTLAIVYVSGRLALWDLERGVIKRDMQTWAKELYSVDWSPDGRVLVTAGHNAAVTLWDASDLSVLREIEAPEWVITARFSPDGSKLLFSGGGRLQNSDRRIETWAIP